MKVKTYEADMYQVWFTYTSYWLIACSTFWRIELVVVSLAVYFVVMLHKALVLQAVMAMSADEVLRVPATIQGCHHGTPEREK